MVNMCHYAEVPEAFDWDGLDAALKLGDRFGSLSASPHRGGEWTDLFEELGCILTSYRAGQPKELE